MNACVKPPWWKFCQRQHCFHYSKPYLATQARGNGCLLPQQLYVRTKQCCRCDENMIVAYDPWEASWD